MSRQGWPDWDIYVERGCHCEYCGFDGTTWPAWNQLAIDHIIPKSQGGKDSRINKAVACSFCNHRKGWYDPRDGQVILEPTNEQSRSELIERARKHMSETDKWNLHSAFTDMMAEIKQRGSYTH